LGIKPLFIGAFCAALFMMACHIQKQNYINVIIDNGSHFEGEFIPYITPIINSDSTTKFLYYHIVKDDSRLLFRKNGTCQITRATGAVEGGPTTMQLERRYGIKNDTLYIRQPDYYERYYLSKNKDTLQAVSMTFSDGKKYVRAVAEEF
jgi:hypothetical protein